MWRAALVLGVGALGCSVPDTVYRSELAQLAYIKASNTGNAGSISDGFGEALALSADGTTLAVGARGEDGSATDVNGPENDDRREAGAVYVFVRVDGEWSQQAYIKPANSGVGDQFGTSLAIAASGSTLVVGAPAESSDARTVDGDPANDKAFESGAAYIFERTGTTWRQQAYLKTSNSDVSDGVGKAVAISGDGLFVAVGAPGEKSNATGINGDGSDNSKPDAGAAYVFARTGSAWMQQAYIKAQYTDPSDAFGSALALSDDGSTLAVGAPTEDSSATGVGGTFDTASPGSGAVYVFTRSGVSWAQQAYIKASNTGPDDRFGNAIAMSRDGSIMAIGAEQEDSRATTIGGAEDDDSFAASGAAYIFHRTGTQWAQDAYVKPPNTGIGDLFGTSISISGDGTSLIVGAYAEASAATGIGGDMADNSAPIAGAAYVFSRWTGAWVLQAYVKASNTLTIDSFATDVAVSADGLTFAAGAPGEDSSARGVDGDQTNRDGTADDSGAAYIFR